MTSDSMAIPSRSSLRVQVSDEVRGRVLELGHEYWKSKVRGGKLPARRDIDPLDVPLLLPQIILLDVARDPWDFRFRLIGTNVVYHLSRDWTGHWFSQINHMAAPSRIFNNCVEVAASGDAFRSQTPYVGPHADYVSAEDIILPLADDGVNVDKLLVFVEHFPRSQHRG